jgi:hypothetical protein
MSLGDMGDCGLAWEFKRLLIISYLWKHQFGS